MTQIKIVAVDDHVLILNAIRSILHMHPEMTLVAEGSTGDDVMALVQKHQPDILLLDQTMPLSHADVTAKKFKPIPAIKRIKREFPHVRIIILSVWTDLVMVQQALAAGARGYISKSDADLDLAEAIKAVMRNELFLSETVNSAQALSATNLTRRQIEVLSAINNDPMASYECLAAHLDMSESTFKKHLSTVMQRMGVPSNKLAAIKLGQTMGLF